MPHTIDPERFERYLLAFLRWHFPHLGKMHADWSKQHAQVQYQRRGRLRGRAGAV
jgi:hypothetical protein